MQVKFERCPFCGYDVSESYWPLQVFDGIRMTTRAIRCEGCGASGPIVESKDGMEAVRRWNMRASEV